MCVSCVRGRLGREETNQECLHFMCICDGTPHEVLKLLHRTGLASGVRKGASKSVTYLCHCELKVFQHKSKHCSKYKREAEEQKQRHTHTQRIRRGGFNATEAEHANRGERLSDCDTQPRQELRN